MGKTVNDKGESLRNSWSNSISGKRHPGQSIQALAEKGKQTVEEKFRKIMSTAIKDANEAAIIWVFTRIVDYGFHARSAVEWRKYQAKKTDRASGKEKKMSTREMLKPGGTVKKESD
jgi:hypothetical protein